MKTPRGTAPGGEALAVEFLGNLAGWRSPPLSVPGYGQGYLVPPGPLPGASRPPPRGSRKARCPRFSHVAQPGARVTVQTAPPTCADWDEAIFKASTSSLKLFSTWTTLVELLDHRQRFPRALRASAPPPTPAPTPKPPRHTPPQSPDDSATPTPASRANPARRSASCPNAGANTFRAISRFSRVSGAR